MSAITTATDSLPVYQTAPLRKARVEIQKLHQPLMLCSQDDHLTITLKKVVTYFQDGLSGIADVEAWKGKLITFLQSALADLSDPWLGCDGHAYSGEALTVYYAQCEEEKLECSPVTGEEGFFLEPHQAAHVCIEWLKWRGIDVEDPEVHAAYLKLRDKGWALPLPTRANRWLRHAYWRQIQQVQQLEEMTSFAQSLATAEPAVAEFEREVRRVVQEAEEGAGHIEKLMQSAQRQHIRFMEGSAQLQAELNKEQLACDELQQQCVELGNNIAITHHEIEEMQKAVQACAQALEELEELRTKRQILRVACVIVNISFAVSGGMSFAAALGVQTKRAVVSLGVSTLVKDPTIGAILTGGINGVTEAPLSQDSYVTAAVKGAALPAIIGAAKAAGVGELPRGALNGLVATTLSKGPVQPSDLVANTGLGVVSGALTEATDVNLDLSVRQKKIHVSMQI